MCLYDFLHVSVFVCIVHVSVIYTPGCIRIIYTLVHAEGIETGADDGGETAEEMSDMTSDEGGHDLSAPAAAAAPPPLPPPPPNFHST